MRMKGTHCLSPDSSGRVCGTAAGSRCTREAEGQVDGALSFGSFCLPSANLNLGHFMPSLFFRFKEKQSHPAQRAGCLPTLGRTKKMTESKHQFTAQMAKPIELFQPS